MAYLIREKYPPGDEARRVVTEQIARAHDLLREWQANPRDNIHQARQSFKRVRALLRLIRPGARYIYRVENTAFRDLGRSLAYARDAEAVVDAIGLLEGGISGPLARESLSMLKHGLEQRARREQDCSIRDFPRHIEAACQALQAAAERVPDMPLDDLRRRDLRRGARRTVQRCRAQFEAASASRAPEAFHSWRREVKYAYHQTRLMNQLMPGWAAGCGPTLGRLADTLGHYQDLCVLDRLLRNQVDELNIDVHLRSIRNALRNVRSEMEVAALRIGGECDRGIDAMPDREHGQPSTT